MFGIFFTDFDANILLLCKVHRIASIGTEGSISSARVSMLSVSSQHQVNMSILCTWNFADKWTSFFANHASVT